MNGSGKSDKNKKTTTLNIINTNARSLCPKIESLIDCINETDTQIAVVTETWMKEGDRLDEVMSGLSLGSGIGMLHRSRDRCAANGVFYGGVALLWMESVGSFKKVQVKNPEEFEVLTAVGTLHGQSRKMIIIACYIPPNYKTSRGKACLQFVSEIVLDMKRKFADPYLVITGDFNQWDIADGLSDFSDVREEQVGPTRGLLAIDRIFTNMSRSVQSSGTWAPLQTTDSEEDARTSDHRVAFCAFELRRRETFTWKVYSYRHYTDEAEEAFKRWIVLHDWKEVHEAVGSNNKTNVYQRTLQTAIEEFFPLRTTKRKSTDLPWLSRSLLNMIEKRKRLFVLEGCERTPAWKKEKSRIDALIRKRKRGYMDNQKSYLLQDDASRNFFKHVKNFAKFEKPKPFEVQSLMPGKSDMEVAEILAEYFNKVSLEFDPLSPDQIPATKESNLPGLALHEVAARIRKFRKPKSMVPGDIFPSLMTKFADFFAIPLANIYNEITRTYVWPLAWKKEFVTVIPKKTPPAGLEDLRNISCTMLASKIYESYVLDWLKSEVTLRSNQYGGVRGVGTDHVLVQLWQDILQNLEDYRAATVVTSIDYSKAFNRMSYQHCLAALAKNGATTGVLRLVATFLTGRTMTVKVGSISSVPRGVSGGCPQGSILGVFLFNATIDDLEEGCRDLHGEKSLPARSLPEESGDGSDMESEEEQPPTMECSTPVRGTSTRAGVGGVLSPIIGLHGRVSRRTKLRKKRRLRRLDTSTGLIQSVPHEPNDRTESKWRPILAKLLRYIDDGFNLSKVNFENSFGFCVNGVNHRVKHAVQAQNVFRHVVRNAESIGMKVNSAKTTLVCFSDSLAYEADAYIEDEDGNRIRGQRSMKALGMRFSSRPDMQAHVDWVKKTFRQRYWMLRNLKRNGFTEDELIQVYRTMIRPVAEYACVVYHSTLTDQQDEELERLQSHALACIYGGGISARQMRSKADLPSLRERRIELCDKFAKKALANPRFTHWFPVKQGRSSARTGVQKEPFLEERARCQRLFNSPLFYFRRRLNGKEGKTYGIRNEEYRK